MGIFRHPPPPFIGGRQPLAPAELPPSLSAVAEDAPPFAHRLRTVATLAAIVGMWQPSLLGLPQSTRPSVVPSLVAVAAADDPPFSARTTRPTILRSWEPAPPQPQTAWKLSPSLLAVPVDDPPFSARTSLPGILRSWEPGSPQPQVAWKLSASLLDSPVDDPPILGSSRVSLLATTNAHWQPGPPRPWFGWAVHPSIAAVAEHDPPFGQRTTRALQAWHGPIVVPERVRQIAATLVDAVVNDPPFGARRPTLTVILDAWRPPPPHPWFGWQVHPSIQAVAEDNPPPSQRRTMTIHASWYILDDHPARRRPGMQALSVGVAVVADVVVQALADVSVVVAAADPEVDAR